VRDLLRFDFLPLLSFSGRKKLKGPKNNQKQSYVHKRSIVSKKIGKKIYESQNKNKKKCEAKIKWKKFVVKKCKKSKIKKNFKNIRKSKHKYAPKEKKNAKEQGTNFKLPKIHKSPKKKGKAKQNQPSTRAGGEGKKAKFIFFKSGRQTSKFQYELAGEMKQIPHSKYQKRKLQKTLFQKPYK